MITIPFIEYATVIVFYSTIVVFILLAGINRKRLYDVVGKISEKEIISLLALMFVFFILANSLNLSFPTFGDEFLYMGIAKELATEGRYASCDFDGVEQQCTLSNKPHNVYPLLLASVFFFSGVSLDIAVLLNIVLATITIPVMYLFTKVLTDRADISLFATIMLVLWPANLFLAKSMETNTASLFFTILTLFLFFVWKKKRDNGLLLLCVVGLSITVQARVENILMVPLFIAFYFLSREKTNKKGSIMWVLFFLLIALQITQLVILFIVNSPLGYEIEKRAFFIPEESLGNIIGLSIVILLHPIYLLTTILFIVALFYRRKEMTFLLVFLLTFLVMTLVYVGTDYIDVIGGDVALIRHSDRFLFPCLAVLFPFAAFGGMKLSIRLGKIIKKDPKIVFWSLVSLFIVLSLSNVSEMLEYDDSAHYTAYSGFLDVLQYIPPDCKILIHDPLFASSLTDTDVLDLSGVIEEPSRLIRALDHSCVVYYEDPRARDTMPGARDELAKNFSFYIIINETRPDSEMYYSLERIDIDLTSLI